MSKHAELTGLVFGRYTVLSYAGRDKTYNSKWLCRCQCGVEKVVYALALKGGDTVSCGCYGAENSSKLKTTHGQSHGKRTKEYVIWMGMRQRCNNPNFHHYHNYGGRGISVCERWNNSFQNFFEDMGRCPEGKSIDRIDNFGNYELSNCKWSTPKEQAQNRRPRNSSLTLTIQ